MRNRLHFSSNPDREHLHSRILDEHRYIGYYRLPEQNIDNILEFIQNFERGIDRVVVVGIGGSSLGTEAIYRFLKPKGREILFLDTTDPIYIQETLDRVDFDRSHFFIISKSGKTIETISLLSFYTP